MGLIRDLSMFCFFTSTLISSIVLSISDPEGPNEGPIIVVEVVKKEGHVVKLQIIGDTLPLQKIVSRLQ